MIRMMLLALGLSMIDHGLSEVVRNPEVMLSKEVNASSTSPGSLKRFLPSECQNLSTDEQGRIRTFLPSGGTYCEIFELVISKAVIVDITLMYLTVGLTVPPTASSGLT